MTARPSPVSAAVPVSQGGWTFKAEQLENCPSVQDGIPMKELARRKYDMFHFIEQLRINLSMPVHIGCTAMVFIHRFYAYQSLKDFPNTADTFAAPQAEDKFYKHQIIIKWAHHLHHVNLNQAPTKLDENGEEFFLKKEALFRNEGILLKTLGFDVIIQHPMTAVIATVKILRENRRFPVGLAPDGLTQLAWEWCLCAHGHDFCLTYPPEIIAVGLLYGAAKDMAIQISTSNDQPWWNYCVPKGINLTEADLQKFMMRFYDYCMERREPRLHAKDPKKPKKAPAPPKNPVFYLGAPLSRQSTPSSVPGTPGTPTTFLDCMMRPLSSISEAPPSPNQATSTTGSPSSLLIGPCAGECGADADEPIVPSATAVAAAVGDDAVECAAFSDTAVHTADQISLVFNEGSRHRRAQLQAPLQEDIIASQFVSITSTTDESDEKRLRVQ